MHIMQLSTSYMDIKNIVHMHKCALQEFIATNAYACMYMYTTHTHVHDTKYVKWSIYSTHLETIV